jgi:hypothetical protein
VDRADLLRLARSPGTHRNAIIYRALQLGHTPGMRPAGWGLFGRTWIGRCSCGWESQTRRRVNADVDMTVHLGDEVRQVDGVSIPGPELWPPGITSESTSMDWERALLKQLRRNE